MNFDKRKPNTPASHSDNLYIFHGLDNWIRNRVGRSVGIGLLGLRKVQMPRRFGGLRKYRKLRRRGHQSRMHLDRKHYTVNIIFKLTIIKIIKCKEVTEIIEKDNP